MPRIAAADLFELSVPEKIQLVEDLWDSIAFKPESVGLTPDIRRELDSRLQEHEQSPGEVSSWDEVRSRLWRRL